MLDKLSLEIDEVITPDLGCVRKEVYTELKDNISNKKELPYIMLAYGREYLEKWERHLHSYTDRSKCDEKLASAFDVSELKVNTSYQTTYQHLIQN